MIGDFDDRRLRDLEEQFASADVGISQHCVCLADCGLVASRPDGRATVYSLARAEPLEVLAVA